MKLSVLALDYDGTFTLDDRPHASMLAAVADARRRKITVIPGYQRIHLEEIEALRKHCDACRHLDSSAWLMLPDLRIDQRVALLVTDEAGTELRRFVIGERLTPHVRHRQKYVDVPVSDHHAFVFGSDHRKKMVRAHTLREFAAVVEELDESDAGDTCAAATSRGGSATCSAIMRSRELKGYERRYAKEKYREVLDEVPCNYCGWIRR